MLPPVSGIGRTDGVYPGGETPDGAPITPPTGPPDPAAVPAKLTVEEGAVGAEGLLP